MVVLLSGHSGCAWAGLHCRDIESRLVPEVSGGLRSAASVGMG